MESIFREKAIIEKEFESKEPKNEFFRNKDSDNGILRARIYGLNSKLHFTEYSGYTIKNLIYTNFDYFLWLPRKIRNFYYDKETLEYAEKCLTTLEKIGKFGKVHKNSKVGKMINEVNKMLDYEFCLAHNEKESVLKEYKNKINIEFYKTVVNKPIEKLVRHARYSNSNEIKRKYFNEII